MRISRHESFSTDHPRLLDTLQRAPALLLIQDLDGVCMALVRDPLDRQLDPAYLDAARALDGAFYVLTNGEHIGPRGVNAIVDRASGGRAARDGLYLPGLAGGGVQWQDRFGNVAHPGVGADELAFLAAWPARARAFLRTLLGAAPYALADEAIEALLAALVLDNPASPTINANRLHAALLPRPGLYRQAQQALAGFMRQQLDAAAAAGLGEAFFVHYAPNLGRDACGDERAKPATGDDAGTTDYQFMLAGAVKEVGVLVLLNRYYHRRSGHYPLGAEFNARTAPRDPLALRALARASFDPALMPCIVGIGDTVTSVRGDDGQWQRGGSDRGFLQLVQWLGEDFASGNRVLYVDSSGGEVRRPGIDAAWLAGCAHDRQRAPWPALAGITDADDPLRLDVLFPQGHSQYVAFFTELARRRAG